MSLVDPHRDKTEYQALKDWHQPRMAIMREILEGVERILTGTEDLNEGTDTLGADGPPSKSRFR